ncbi:hypothetical protein ACRRS0_10590 [Agarivorans sp. QJM3NY_29]|uniref:hypothetical protein n=1 Tax=unclassified Agarivorans TaxID=2636026 RepID=UPI003D7E9809
MEVEVKAAEQGKHPILRLFTLNRIVGLMTISVPVLYLMGYFYHYSYLDGFGVNSDFFPRSIQDHLVGAFVFMFIVVSNAYKYLNNNVWFLVISGGVGFISFFALMYGFRNPMKNSLVSFIERKGFYEQFESYVIFPAIGAFFGSIFPYGLICLFWLLLLLPAAGVWQGKASAERDLDSFHGCEQSELSQKEKCIIRIVFSAVH